MKKKTIAII
ncbi:hypothetical protein SPV_2519 [Streptococcus pneumoniae]|nr:hypothetical protein SPV_2519 [Streptococcus pneumoniae]